MLQPKLAFVLTLALAFAALPGDAHAKKRRQTPVQERVIEFACGNTDGSYSGAVAADYATTVSAVNTSPDPVRIRAKVLLTVPGSLESDVVLATVDPGRAVTIDCNDLTGDLFMFSQTLVDGEYAQGLLVVRNTGELNVSVRLGSGGNGNAAVQSITVAPTVTQVPRTAMADDDEVEVCHIPPGNPSALHTISVGASAVSAHLGHGDYRGECDDD